MLSKSEREFPISKLKIIKVLIRIPLIVSFFVISSVSIVFAAPWIKTYGGVNNDYANSIQQTSDGGYIVAGSFFDYAAGADVWVLKLDASGTIQRQKTYGGVNNDYANSIQQTFGGGYIVAGATYSFGAGNGDAWVLKLDGNGNVQWQNTYGGSGYDYANSIQQTSDGGYIMAGGTDSFVAGGYEDAWVVKLDGNGNVQWQKTYGERTGNDFFNSIQQTSDGGYIATGFTGPFVDFGVPGNAWILKLDDSGNVQWQKAYGGSDYHPCANSIQQTSDGGYIVAGYSYSSAPISNGYSFAWVLKLDDSGNVQWQKAYSALGAGHANSIQQTSDGGYIVAGDINLLLESNHPDAWIVKLDGNGNVEWEKTYGGWSTPDGANSIQQTSDGGYIVAGYSHAFGAGNADAWVLKLDGNGNIYNCSIVRTSNGRVSSIHDTYATVQDTNVIWVPSFFPPQTSTASISSPNAVVIEKCNYSCSLVSDTTSIHRGGTLRFQATVINNTDEVQIFKFGTRTITQDGGRYPATGYLKGPVKVKLGPHGSQSKLFSQYIPDTVPVGTYAYIGEVGVPGNIQDMCGFTFVVGQ